MDGRKGGRSASTAAAGPCQGAVVPEHLLLCRLKSWSSALSPSFGFGQAPYFHFTFSWRYYHHRVLMFAPWIISGRNTLIHRKPGQVGGWVRVTRKAVDGPLLEGKSQGRPACISFSRERVSPLGASCLSSFYQLVSPSPPSPRLPVAAADLATVGSRRRQRWETGVCTPALLSSVGMFETLFGV